MFRLNQQLFFERNYIRDVSITRYQSDLLRPKPSTVNHPFFFSQGITWTAQKDDFIVSTRSLYLVTITNQNTKGKCRIRVYNLLFREKVWVSLSPLIVETLAIIRPHRSLLPQQDHYSFNKNQIFTCCLNETEETLTRKKFNRQAIILKDLRSLLTVCSAFAVCISSRFCWVIVIQGSGEDLNVFLNR